MEEKLRRIFVCAFLILVAVSTLFAGLKIASVAFHLLPLFALANTGFDLTIKGAVVLALPYLAFSLRIIFANLHSAEDACSSQGLAQAV